MHAPSHVLDALPNAKRSSGRSRTSDSFPGPEAASHSHAPKRQDFRDHYSINTALEKYCCKKDGKGKWIAKDAAHDKCCRNLAKLDEDSKAMKEKADKANAAKDKKGKKN